MAFSTPKTTTSLHQWSKQYIRHQEGVRNVLYNKPPTFQRASVVEQNPKIPSPSLFSSDTGSLHNQPLALPTVAECAIHLELLQTFQHLRLSIISSEKLDTLLGIELNRRTVFRKVSKGYQRYEHEEVQLRDMTFDERRQTKWSLFLSLAATRFLVWVELIEKDRSEEIPLPPLDILMVWHSLLLNPKWFLSLKYVKLSRTPFPWDRIHQAIDSDKSNWPMELPHRSQFHETTGAHPDLLTWLTMTVRSEPALELLKQHDTLVEGATQKGINKADLGSLLQQDVLSTSERLLLQTLQSALSDDPTIMDLVAAVTRQSAFVEKMDRQLWIRSPAVEGTLRRALQRYERFLKLFKMYPRKMLVPTLDIDIAWHTHQCSPAQYMEATKTIAGRFVDHDDKLGSDKLDVGLENTISLYWIRFAEEYEYCLCWDCEALKSAIDGKEVEDIDARAVAKQVELDVTYHRAVEIARRGEQKLLPLPTAEVRFD
ncbi:hypothetical protein BCR34DRAFT_584252 [Clohesyomyces aquaticus]|uniref:Uncharacterized protein n=1 Tax=Clohesyomyces aquaticus TaxID=1231657 RepID=A0A1Y2A299_9PLEO|nr:hypothetical protein BCR34DRAFT_584252 [Clohesyomyces aquaticus]